MGPGQAFAWLDYCRIFSSLSNPLSWKDKQQQQQDWNNLWMEHMLSMVEVDHPRLE